MKFLVLMLVVSVHGYARHYNPFFNTAFENDLDDWSTAAHSPFRVLESREVESPKMFDLARNVLPSSLKDTKHGVKMGIPNAKCDDAKTHLEVDWDGSPVNYTCYTPKHRIPISKNLEPLQECDDIPDKYVPQHVCMDHSLEYNTPYPTHAPHRPLWAKYGEYKFVPPQRWSHNVEHGAVVMLYHPCAHSHLVKELKDIVRSCIWKHVITPSNMIPVDRPLVLVTWGCRLRMNTVNPRLVRSFIRSHALKGPEGTYQKEGQYTELLVHAAKPPIGSSYEDHHLCPKTK